MFCYNNIILLVLLVLLFLLILRYHGKLKNIFGGNLKYKLDLQNIKKLKQKNSYKNSIIRIPNFITNEECKKLINMAKPTLERSLVVGKDYVSNHLSELVQILFR